jgi:hypothetical protein
VDRTFRDRQFQSQLDDSVNDAHAYEILLFTRAFERQPDEFPEWSRKTLLESIHTTWQLEPSGRTRSRLTLVHDSLDVLGCDNVDGFIELIQSHYDDPSIWPDVHNVDTIGHKQLRAFIAEALKEEYAGEWHW